MSNPRPRPFAVGAVLIALIAAACGPAVPSADPSGSASVASRIVILGNGQDWYRAINLVNGRPDAIRYSGDWARVQIRVAPGMDVNAPLVARACDAIAAGLNDPAYGPSLQVNLVELYAVESSNREPTYDCRPLASTLPS